MPRRICSREGERTTTRTGLELEAFVSKDGAFAFSPLHAPADQRRPLHRFSERLIKHLFDAGPSHRAHFRVSCADPTRGRCSFFRRDGMSALRAQQRDRRLVSSEVRLGGHENDRRPLAEVSHLRMPLCAMSKSQ